MQKSYWILLVILLLPLEAAAQVGTCEPALAEAYLDAGNVRARILNNGGLFWRGSPHVYEVGGANAIFASGIWIGGLIDKQLHAAASRYGPWEFWAGPLDEAGNAPVSCKSYDKIWEIRREDIETYLGNGDISNNLKDWPWTLGAPVIDGDGNPNNYNLEGGDIPALLGDQRLWWVMNDRGNTHGATDVDPLGIEIQASAFAYENRASLGNITFYEYNIINKNLLPIKDTYVGFFVDADLGNFDDDRVGSDSLHHLGFTYNADNEDEGSSGYGLAPPALGYTILETILADTDGLDNNRDGSIDEVGEKMGAVSFMHYNGGGGVDGDPVKGSDYYNYMQAKWKDGRPLAEGFTGYYLGDGFPRKNTKFFFSGDPVTNMFWSETNLDGQGLTYQPADRRMIISTGPFDMEAGDKVTLRLAIIWSRGEDYLDSINELRKDTRAVRSVANELFQPRTKANFPLSQQHLTNHVLGFDQNFPNPFAQSTTLRYSLPQTMQVRLAVYDMLGREVALLVDAQQEAGIHTAAFDAGDLPAGVYLARIELDFLRFTKRMVLVR